VEVDMKSRIRRFGILAALALIATLVPLTQARAQNTFRIRVGAFPSQTLPMESMSFFPDVIQVHQGDTLRFTSNSFHTATLLPASVTDPDQWAADNGNPDGPWALFVPDPDDGAAALKLNNMAGFPSDPGCGATDTACQFDGSDANGVLNSGLPQGPEGLDFSVEVTAAPGTTFHVICLVHNAMTMEVQVVDPSADTSTQEEINEERAAQLDRDRARARELDERLSRPRSTRLPNGHRRWRAFAGFDTPNFSLVAMYPRRLRVERGDRVRWSAAANLVFEDHSVTGPRSKAMAIFNNSFVPFCDPDGDGPGPDNPPDAPPPTFCTNPDQLEFDIPARFNRPHGDGRVTRGRDLESSGIFGAGAGGPDFYTLRFTRRLNDPYVYICLIHGPFMSGRVIVR
jgi:plastocyanin